MGLRKNQIIKIQGDNMPEHKLPELGYSYDSLEPFIDAKTMEIHYLKHHQAYVNNLNVALAKYPKLQDKKIEELIKDLNKIPEDIRNAVRNNGGGHLNHTFFWQIMKKGIQPKGDVLKEIEKQFGSFDKFKEEFSKAAMTRFGSGWAWLVVNKGKLEVVSTANQDNPISEGKTPVLGLDVWEHAFYLLRQNRKNEYVEAFWNIINWKQVELNYQKAIKK